MTMTELEKLEQLIILYKNETEPKKKNIIYLNLVEMTLSLVKKIVITFYPLPISVTKEDLVQVGAIGILRAIEVYEPKTKGSFKTYVSKVIKGKISHYLRDKVSLVRTPRDTISNLPKIREAIAELSENYTKTPSVQDVATLVGLSEDKVSEVLQIELTKNMVSLDQKIYTTEGGETLMDRLQDDNDCTFEDTFANKKIIEDAVKRLQPTDRQAICMFYFEDCSRKDISEVLKVSQTQVSRILKRALHRLSVIVKKSLEEE